MSETAFRTIDLGQLRSHTAQFAAAFGEARPYRHVVIENFLHADVARVADRCFPPYTSMQKRFNGLVEARAVDRRFDRFDPTFTQIFEDLRSPEFIAWVEDVTGISNLGPDDTNTSGGLHQSRNGSYHNVHADQNRHPISGMYQRVNFLLYLNERWQPGWGGELEMWDATMTQCVTRVEPKFNRCVLMEVHDKAYHGVPPLRVPDDVTRKSLTCWYFSPERAPLQSAEAHEVLFTLRPQDPLGTRLRHALRKAVGVVRRARGGRSRLSKPQS